MPFPLPPQIASTLRQELDNQELRGDGTEALVKALSTAFGGAVALFVMAKCQVLPGQPALVIPPPAGVMNGSTIAPGDLNGALSADEATVFCRAAFADEGLETPDAKCLAAAAGETLSKALDAFVQNVKAAPGAVIMGGVTLPPGGTLMALKPAMKWGIEDAAVDALKANGIAGEGGKKLAPALGASLVTLLDGMVGTVLVLPGVAAAPGATTSPGKLL